MTEFSTELVKNIAKLARIRITEDEAIKFSGDLTMILSEIEKLAEVDTTNIEPLSNITESEMQLRDDKVTAGDISSEVLSNAKNAEFNCFVVPKVIE